MNLSASVPLTKFSKTNETPLDQTAPDKIKQEQPWAIWVNKFCNKGDGFVKRKVGSIVAFLLYIPVRIIDFCFNTNLVARKPLNLFVIKNNHLLNTKNNTDIVSYIPDAEITTQNIENALNILKGKGIRLLAIDFDHTLSGMHTGGCWEKSSKELAEHVRYIFLQLIPIAIKSGFKIAVVTFSPQEVLIKEVLGHVFKENANKIYVRCHDLKKDGSRFPANKQVYIQSAINYFNKEALKKDLDLDNILLIDDDIGNYRAALQNKTKALYFNIENPNILIKNMLEM